MYNRADKNKFCQKIRALSEVEKLELFTLVSFSIKVKEEEKCAKNKNRPPKDLKEDDIPKLIKNVRAT